MSTETMGEHRRGSAGRDATYVSVGRPVLVHHVVARQGNKGLEILCIPLEGKGATLPVFTAGGPPVATYSPDWHHAGGGT